MARFVLTDVRVKVNNIDLTDHVASVTISTEVEDVETTAFGSSARTRIGGLSDSSIELEFHQDYAAGSVDATIAPLVGGTCSFEVIPNGTAVSATNPRYGGTVLVTEWSPVDGSIGDLAAVSVTWPVSGAISRGTV